MSSDPERGRSLWIQRTYGSTGKWKVLSVEYAWRQARRREHFDRSTGGENMDAAIRTAFYCWAVGNGEFSIVIDVGCSRETAEGHGMTYLGNPREAMSSLSRELGPVRACVVTHLHWDHCDLLSEWADVPVIISYAEVEYWLSLYRSTPTSELLEGTSWSALSELDRRTAGGGVLAYDNQAHIAPGLGILCLGGHTGGNSVVGVSAATGRWLLASDAVHYREHLDLRSAHPEHLERNAAESAIAWIGSSFARDEVVPGHDPDCELGELLTGDFGGCRVRRLVSRTPAG